MPQLNCRAIIAAFALTLAVGGSVGARWTAHSVHADNRAFANGMDQIDACPKPIQPGQLIWNFPTEGTVAAAPAIGDDGTLFFGTMGGQLFGVSCQGEQRWRIESPVGSAQRGISLGPPVLHSDGRLYFGFGAINMGLLFMVKTDGSDAKSIRIIDPIGASPVVDPLDRVFVGTLQPRALTFGVIRGFDPEQRLLPGFPIRTNAINVAPVLLESRRIVFVTRNGPAAASSPITGTVTATPAFPIRRTPMPIASPTPTSSATATASPTAIASATASSTPPSSATPRPLRWSVVLPLAHNGVAAALAATHRSQSAHDTPDTPLQRATATPLPGFPTSPPVGTRSPALLHIITDARAPGKTFGLSDASATSIIATGDVVIVTLDERPPRMVALALDSDPPVILWEHFTAGAIAGSPVLGPLDPATGRMELIYADSSGLLVSLDVPGTPQAEGEPTFNWAIRLNSPALGAPVLGDTGMVYVATATAVHAFSRANGSDGWTFDWTGGVGESFTGALSLAPGGALYVGTQLAIVAISTESRGLDPQARWPAPRRDHRNSGQAMP